MAMTFDSTNSDNPVTAIEEVHDAFRRNMRNHCSAQVIKLKWIKGYDAREAYTVYLEQVKKNGVAKHWKELLVKVEHEVLGTFNHVCDDWMLSSLTCFEFEKEIWDAFEFEWKSVGERPAWFIPQNQVEGMEKQSPTE